METFTNTKELIPNPDFDEQRINSLREIDYSEIDPPIVDLIKKISKMDYCFTLQSCFGHFLYKGQTDFRSTDPLPVADNFDKVNYRIAYIAFCIKKCDEGETLLKELSKVYLIEPEYIQFGCAEWFWDRQVNSYVLQVEPERFKNKDKISVEYQEALYIEKIRNVFFKKLNEIINNCIK